MEAGDVVMIDDDGVVVLPASRVPEVADAACAIRDLERAQAARMREGTTLREQVRFDEYLRTRASGTTFREHLRAIGGAIEE